MKITQTRLKQIIQEEVAAVAAEGWEHAQADTTAAAASRDIDINQTYEDVLHLSSYLDTEEERNLLQQAAEILKNYSGALEEGELEESFADGDRRWDEMEKERIRKAQQAIADERDAQRKREQGGGSGYDHGGVRRTGSNFREE
tara:strand:- start:597 stop:1028 length:432 start_codon:yes stop_codon:yes gene_type:complete